MYSADSLPGEVPVVAVIGAGASGTLATVHLLREAAAKRLPLCVALIDRHGRHGRGQAYSTTHPQHLLNAPADAMSAFGGDPGHLVRWAAQNQIRYDGFLPRSAYGDYLCEVLADAERRAAPWARVSQGTSRVAGIRQDCGRRALRLDLAADGRIDADVVILATGSPAVAAALPVPAGPRFVADPWEPAALDRVADGSQVVIVGTGPTMIDVAIALTSAHPDTTVVAVSRHGLLPHVHTWPRHTPSVVSEPVVSSRAAPLRLAWLIRHVRAIADSQAGDWQDVIDALRPQIPSLWRQLPEPDKRLFLRHVARYWEVHRHLMPPATAEQVRRLRASGRLVVLRGRIVSAAEIAEGIRVGIDLEDSQAELNAGWLVNCSGPGSDIAGTGDPLLRHLFETGLARPDSLRLGLDADWRGAIRGAASTATGNLYSLGPLLRGLRYETTAIPEIRDQAASLAAQLVARIARASPRSAA